LRRECRVFRGTCGDYRVLTTNAHGLRVQRAPGFPCALCFPGRKILSKLGRIAPRDRAAMFGEYERATLSVVIARQRVGA
jgi:hypothetical protein